MKAFDSGKGHKGPRATTKKAPVPNKEQVPKIIDFDLNVVSTMHRLMHRKYVFLHSFRNSDTQQPHS